MADGKKVHFGEDADDEADDNLTDSQVLGDVLECMEMMQNELAQMRKENATYRQQQSLREEAFNLVVDEQIKLQGVVSKLRNQISGLEDTLSGMSSPEGRAPPPPPKTLPKPRNNAANANRRSIPRMVPVNPNRASKAANRRSMKQPHMLTAMPSFESKPRHSDHKLSQDPSFTSNGLDLAAGHETLEVHHRMSVSLTRAEMKASLTSEPGLVPGIPQTEPKIESYEDYKQGLEAPPPDLPPIESNIVVAVRCRPLSKREFEEKHMDVIKTSEGRMVHVSVRKGTGADVDYLAAKRVEDKKFVFDRAYNGFGCSQEDVFNGVVKDLVTRVVNGENATCFAYGATGSGKTHTMIGTPELPGVTVLAMRELFEQLEGSTFTTVEVSFLEVYCENVKDLLNSDPEAKPLDIREANHEVHVKGLTALLVTTADEVMAKLHQGNKRRTMRATNSNETSSRSHAVFQVKVNKQYTTAVKVSTLSMIDLAGSERMKKSEVNGLGATEATKINQSLLALGNCITALASGNKSAHVPFRESKLTRLLQNSLGGNCRTVMIAAISPSNRQIEETLNTLKYANRAKDIKTLTKAPLKRTLSQ